MTTHPSPPWSPTAVPEPVRARRAPSPLSRLVHRHPLLVLMLVFNTCGQAAVFATLEVNRRSGLELNLEVVQSAALTVFLLIPALVITRTVHGQGRFRRLLREMVRFDVPARWYVLPLVVLPVLGLLANLPAFGGDLGVRELALAYVLGFLPSVLLQFLSTNWWEETVWTGVVQGPLQQRWGATGAVLLSTPLFALQHLFLVYGMPLAQALTTMGLLTASIVFVRAGFGWVYNRTHSLALVGLLHAASNAVALGMVQRLTQRPGDGILPLVALGLVLLVVTRGRLGRQR